jgi:hypothetical protein
MFAPYSFGFSRQIFVNVVYIEFYKNPSGRSREDTYRQNDGRGNMMNLAGRFRELQHSD